MNHFQGKDAITHVAEAQARGIIASSEVHGTEMPGSISAAADAARETAILLILAGIISHFSNWQQPYSFFIFAGFLLGWLIWKVGRSAWLGWSRLERLHRILEEERWEIEHNRSQEREELKALYAAKGFEGQLLEDVLDVLMADGDRLLKVMIEEELGLSLEIYEHPLKQSLGAAIGVVAATLLGVSFFFALSSFGLFVSAAITIGSAAAVSAHFEKNRLIPAIVWNLGLAFFAGGSAYFLLEYLL